MKKKVVLARPLTRSRLHEEIVAIIQKQIMNGTIAPGSKLPPERELAETFNVNRATVREALRKLENLDLVEIRHGDGLYAKNYLESGNLDLIKAAFNMDESKEIILNILEARRHVVPQMAYLAAQRRTEADLNELEQVVFKSDLTMLERDIKVHQLIARASHNLLCTIGLNFFNQLFRDYGYLYFDDEQNVECSRVFHREIYEAIKNQNPEESRRIMLDVLIYAEEAVKSNLAEKL
ncbi:MAG: FadR/GntR family transcriptional regulator [Deltaproteobacteria bacterium]|nr:FadR/GntR family transcriptional regulator [Deltaproteobacteria bacterium]